MPTNTLTDSIEFTEHVDHPSLHYHHNINYSVYSLITTKFLDCQPRAAREASCSSGVQLPYCSPHTTPALCSSFSSRAARR